MFSAFVATNASTTAESEVTTPACPLLVGAEFPNAIFAFIDEFQSTGRFTPTGGSCRLISDNPRGMATRSAVGKATPSELLEHLCENNRDLPVLERYWRRQEQAGASTKGKQ